MNNSSTNSLLMNCLINPRGVVIIGSSDNHNKVTGRPLKFLRKNRFSGQVYVINPNRSAVQGETSYNSISEIDGPIDHAYILLNSDMALEALEECGEAGIPLATILADGFAEAGRDGERRQQKMLEIINKTGIRVLGPNSMGGVNLTNGFICTTNAAFVNIPPPAGRFAVLSQSGSLVGGLLSRGRAAGVDFSLLIALGNEADLDVGEVGELLVDHPETDAFILFLETIRYPEKFAKFASKAQKLGKPVVVYKLGRSLVGQQLAVSHTGAVIGSDAAVDCFFKQHGVLRVNNLSSLLELPPVLLSMKRNNNKKKLSNGIIVVSATGGGGALIVDNLAAKGVDIKSISNHVRRRLEGQGIKTGNSQLVDVTLAGANYETMKTVVKEILLDNESDFVVVTLGSSALTVPEATTLPIIDAVKEVKGEGANLIVFLVPYAPEAHFLLRNNDIVAMNCPEVCAEVIDLALSYSPQKAVEKPPIVTITPKISSLVSTASNSVLSEIDSGMIIDALGIKRPNYIFTDINLSKLSTAEIKYPVAVKLVAQNMPHKTEAGTVTLNLQNINETEVAVKNMIRSVKVFDENIQIDGVLIQEMISGRAEVMIGMTRDPNVGPVITLAVGGILTELYKDYSIRLAPVTFAQALGMIDEVTGLAIITGYRGAQKGDLDALAKAIVSFSTLSEYENIMEAEINPLIIMDEGKGVYAVDGMIRVAAK